MARMALGARSKLRFVDGSCSKPAEGSTDLQKWLSCDFMVRCWILNSIVPQVAESLMFAQSVQELWKELIERFGEAYQPLVYQLNHDSTLLAQENDPVSIYFSKLKKIWDELQELEEFPKCTCAASKSYTRNLIKKIQDMDSRNKLFQFLM